MIHDELTDRTDLSRQRKAQLRRMRDGLCVRCKKLAVTKNYCQEHRQEVNVRNRERLHRLFPNMKRNKSCASYHLENDILATTSQQTVQPASSEQS